MPLKFPERAEKYRESIDVMQEAVIRTYGSMKKSGKVLKRSPDYIKLPRYYYFYLTFIIEFSRLSLRCVRKKWVSTIPSLTRMLLMTPF
jgi:hypothetical protein